DTLPYLALSAATMCATAMLTATITNTYILLPTRIVVAATIYIIALFLCRSQELREAIEYVKSRKTSKR
ncbi:MAG: lipopolysaccharide biosynthesis protein, partial [Bacteroidaceae bacterium]|nr:lipopolysaccharide biosynthesis protein [Bacteroidaceae bacterium]